MLTKMDILRIFLTVLVSALLFLGLIWLICEFAPILIGAIVFIPWLGAALSNGAKM